MIVVETDRIYCVYVRTSNRTKWTNAEYLGRYSTVDEAIKVAHERMKGTPFMYAIEDMFTGERVAVGGIA